MSLSKHDRDSAEEVVRRLLEGSAVAGFFFVTDAPVIHFDRDPPSVPDVTLVVESRCELVNAVPSEAEIGRWHGQRPFAELWPELASLARQRVERAALALEAAHLLLRFGNGKTLVIAGADPQYESWTVSVKGGPETVVALAGGDVAIWR